MFFLRHGGASEPNQSIEAFAVTCNDGKVEGESILLPPTWTEEIDPATNERSTRIYIQHTGALETFLGSNIVTGIDGVKSERIRVVCRR